MQIAAAFFIFWPEVPKERRTQSSEGGGASSPEELSTMTEPRSFALNTLLAGLLLGAGAFAGCQPGTLPCDSSPEWETICSGAGGGTGSGGMAGGGGGMSGSGGGMAQMGGMMGMVTPPPTAATAVANCAAFPNLGEMDKFFAMRCGDDATCHVPQTAVVWHDFKTAEVWKRAVDLKGKTECIGAPMVDKADHTKSVLWAKVQNQGKCPDGSNVKGMRMPQKYPTKPEMFLTQDEMTCLEGFLKALK
jgi:hypothetical protein